MSDEGRYTLAEAQRILAADKCDRDGHDIRAVRQRQLNGALAVDGFRCERCGVGFFPRPEAVMRWLP